MMPVTISADQQTTQKTEKWLKALQTMEFS